MSRHIISYEGHVEKFDKTLLEPGSVCWPETRVPILWNFDTRNPNNMLGWATDFRREATGEITAELGFTHKRAEIEASLDVMYATIYAKDVVQKITKGVKYVTTCNITAVCVTIASEDTWNLRTEVGERSVSTTGAKRSDT